LICRPIPSDRPLLVPCCLDSLLKSPNPPWSICSGRSGIGGGVEPLLEHGSKPTLSWLSFHLCISLISLRKVQVKWHLDTGDGQTGNLGQQAFGFKASLKIELCHSVSLTKITETIPLNNILVLCYRAYNFEPCSHQWGEKSYQLSGECSLTFKNNFMYDLHYFQSKVCLMTTS
jgi:hypothetical protein